VRLACAFICQRFPARSVSESPGARARLHCTPVPALGLGGAVPPPPPLRSPMPSPPIRTLIVDDHPAMRAGVATVLEQEDDITVVGAASGGRQL